jgi:hypothetical protein
MVPDKEDDADLEARLRHRPSAASRESRTLPIVKRTELPSDQRARLQEDETVHHFAFIDVKGGCANPSSSAKQWILITNRRILYEAAVQEGMGLQHKYVHQTGSIMMAKVSFVGTATTQGIEGCAQTQTTTLLRINSSGGEIFIAIPTKSEATRIQGVIDEILSLGK